LDGTTIAATEDSDTHFVMVAVIVQYFSPYSRSLRTYWMVLLLLLHVMIMTMTIKCKTLMGAHAAAMAAVDIDLNTLNYNVEDVVLSIIVLLWLRTWCVMVVAAGLVVMTVVVALGQCKQPTHMCIAHHSSAIRMTPRQAAVSSTILFFARLSFLVSCVTKR
jgi:hypothetical protein